jgi:hypothetical protein
MSPFVMGILLGIALCWATTIAFGLWVLARNVFADQDQYVNEERLEAWDRALEENV